MRFPVPFAPVAPVTRVTRVAWATCAALLLGRAAIAAPPPKPS